MKLNKPHVWFWFFGILVLFIELINHQPDDTIDFNIYDTYYVIPSLDSSILISIFFLIIGFIYYVHDYLKTSLIKALTQTHIIATLTGFIAYLIVSIIDKPDTNPLFSKSFDFTDFLAFLIIISVFIQPIIFLNSLLSIIIKTTKRTKL